MGSFLPSWIRIRIPNTDHPDPLTWLNPDPIRIRLRNPDSDTHLRNFLWAYRVEAGEGWGGGHGGGAGSPQDLSAQRLAAGPVAAGQGAPAPRKTVTTNPLRQFCGSGSVGSVCFCTSWIQILISSSKNSKKNLDSYCFVTSFWLYIFWLYTFEKWCKFKFILFYTTNLQKFLANNFSGCIFPIIFTDLKSA